MAVADKVKSIIVEQLGVDVRGVDSERGQGGPCQHDSPRVARND